MSRARVSSPVPAPPRPLGARALVEVTVDEGSFTSWDEPVDLTGLDPGYRATLERGRERSGCDESVLTGRAELEGQPVALVVSEFGFLGGSIGRAAGRRIVAAVRRATAEGLPLVAATASGGTRMQEGTPAFVTMVDITRAVVDHRAAGLPYLVYLRHPTTGGVFASWASLGDLLLAEPGALIGFLGPVVYQTLRGEPFPPGVQRAEHLVASGLLDAVVGVEDLGPTLARTLRLLAPCARAASPTVASGPAVPGNAGDAWSSVQLSRRADRPGLAELLQHAADDVVLLHGTQTGRSEDGLVVALASLGGTACVLVGHDRSARTARPLGPAALRGARRGMRLAQQLRRPLVCVIDTPGADLSVEAEEGGLAAEIARCLADMVALTVPSVAVLLGEGAGGAALALLPARRVVAAQHAWLAPLPPEGASAILYRDADHAAELARAQRICSTDLLADGIVHAVVAEDPPAHLDPVRFCHRVAAEIVAQLSLQTSGVR